MSEPEKQPVETLETLAKKLAYTQKTIEELNQRISWHYVRSICVGFGMIGLVFVLALFNQKPTEGSSVVGGILFFYGISKIIAQ